MEAIQVIELLPSTKESLKDFIDKITMSMLDGDMLQAAIQIKSLEEVSKQLRANKHIRDAIVDEVEKYGKDAGILGNLISVAETGTKWDFREDEKLAKLVQQETAIKLKIKARQEELKAGLGKLPALKSSTTNYKVSLK